MNYKQITADEALKLCREGKAVLAARYVENLTFRQATEFSFFLAPNEVNNTCATSHNWNRQGRPMTLGINVAEVSEMRRSKTPVADMAETFGVEVIQMRRWINNHKKQLDKADQIYSEARALAEKCLSDKKEDKNENIKD